MPSKIYFSAIGSDGNYEPWVSDGTSAGTVQVNNPNLNPRLFGLAPSNFASLNGQPFFTGFDGANHANLFTVNAANTAVEIATPAGSSAGLAPGTSFQPGSVAFNGKLYFRGIDQNNQYGLFASDGTGAGTVRLPVPGSSGSVTIRHLTRFGNLLAFGADLSTFSSSLFLTDGTAVGTRTVAVNGASPLGLSIQSMAVAGGKLVFAGKNSANNIVLWASDGTTAGTMQLAVPGLNPANDDTGWPLGLIAFGSKAAFSATDAQGNSGVWVTDGTVAGTVELAGVTDKSAGLPMAALPGGRLAFIATDAADHENVFVTDGTAVTELQVGAASASGLFPHALIVLGNQLLFDAVASSGVRSLFTSDGTSAGTSLLRGGVSMFGANIDTDAAIVGPGPSTAAASSLLVYSTGAAVIATAAPGTAGDALTVSLLSDTAFPAGSAVSINAQNQVVYRAGTVTTANAGVDTLQFRVTDSITGQTVDGSASIRLLAGSQPASPDPLFDVAYYVAHNPDVAAAGIDPYAHYMTYGWHEGRNPDAFFDTNGYLAQNPDVKAAGLNPLTHFEAYGWKEARDPSLAFSDSKYVAANPDVAAAKLDPLAHFLTYGQAEGRMAFLSGGTVPADPLVDAAYYDPQLGATIIPTGAAAAQQAAFSYDAAGWQRHLNPDALFDTGYYLSRNPDVAAARIDPLAHYEAYGWKEGRDPSAAFSTGKYLAANADVAAARVDPLLHYVVNGQAEGRAAFHV